MNEAQEKGITASLASDGCGFHLSRLIPMHTQFVDAPADVSRAVVTGLNALLDAKRPAEQREAEQIPHPVAEAEQSPQPDERAMFNDFWKYETDPIVRSIGWECWKARAALAQAPTRKRLIVESPDAERSRREAQP